MADSTSEGGTFFEKFGTPIALLLGLIIIAGAIMYGRPNTAGTGDTGQAVTVDIKDVKTDTSPFIGDANAPVTVAVWFDYQCPYCKRFELETMAQVMTDYVTSGKVKIVYKDYQFLGPDSDTAALYARAVWATYPERFGEWFVAMAEAQDQEHGGFGDLASIQALTTGLGLDDARITSVMNERKAEFQAAVAADRAEGTALGVKGTPGAIIGTTLVEGAQPYTVVKPLIEAELAS